MQGKDVNTLADDPEKLATDLQALAGPAAGPGGDSVYIDGFSGGQLPLKHSIREIRINQNPFSPEYDKLGYGRVEILTKPGADKLPGDGYFNFGDSVWNSRNPYAAKKAPFLLKEYGGSLEGPLNKLASFFLTVDRSAIDNGAIINGTALDSNTLAIINAYTQIPIPRYSAFHNGASASAPGSIINSRRTIPCRGATSFPMPNIRHSGVRGFDLVSTGIQNSGTDETAQVANTLDVHESRGIRQYAPRKRSPIACGCSFHQGRDQRGPGLSLSLSDASTPARRSKSRPMSHRTSDRRFR